MSTPHREPQKEDAIKSEKDKEQQLNVHPTGLFDSIVVVLVGPGKQRFDIHKGLLCKSSGRFQASLLGPSKEASGKIELPEHTPSTFAFIQHWLYREKLRGFHDVEFNKPTITYLSLINYKAVPFTALIDLYVLVYDYYIPSTYEDKDDNATLLFWTHNAAVRPADLEGPATGINRAWEALPRTSHLEKPQVLLFCNSIGDLDSRPEDEELHPGFMRAIAQKYASRWWRAKDTTGWGFRGAIRTFHEHGYEECLKAVVGSGDGAW